jgi:hypothetical protein
VAARSVRQDRVKVPLNAALVREATELFGDFTAVAEASLRRNIAQEKRLRDPDFRERLKASSELAIRFHERHGLWGEEFSTL